MNLDKSFVYDERPGFESYSMMNMYPMMPMMPNNTNCYNNLESRISSLEKKVNILENNLRNIQNSMYPQATDYSSYQNSMNIM